MAAFLPNSKALDGTWAIPLGGNWSDPADWSGGAVADDGGAADFGQQDIPAGATAVNLDSGRTLGALLFGDQDPSTAGTWTVNGSGILTLTGSSAVTTDVATTIGSQISGLSGLTKLGASSLTLTSGANNWTGGTVLSSGTLVLGTNVSFGTGGLPLSSGTVTFQGGTLSHAYSAANTLVYDATNAWAAAAGTTSTVMTPNRFRLNSGVSGEGNLNLIIGTTVSRADLQNDWAGFSGALNVTGAGTVRLGVNALGSGQPKFNAAGWANTTLGVDGVTLAPTTNSFGNTILIGALTSTGTAGILGGGTAGTVTYSIGSKNLSTTFGGTITGNAALAKTGTGALTLTGANNYTGATTVSGGTLLINGQSATSAVTVSNSGSVLGGSGTINGPVVVNAGAILQGGNGEVGTVLTLAGSVTLGDASVIQLTLGPSGTHSALAMDGAGILIFDDDQAFSFIDLGASAGLYDNIITGVDLDPGTTGTWTIQTAGFQGQFSYDGLGNIDLALVAAPVPEPGTMAALALALLVLAAPAARRFRRRTNASTS